MVAAEKPTPIRTLAALRAELDQANDAARAARAALAEVEPEYHQRLRAANDATFQARKLARRVAEARTGPKLHRLTVDGALRHAGFLPRDFTTEVSSRNGLEGHAVRVYLYGGKGGDEERDALIARAIAAFSARGWEVERERAALFVFHPAPSEA